MCDKVILNVAKVSYESENGNLNTCYSNLVKTNILKKTKLFDFCLKMCFDLCEIKCSNFCVLGVDIYSDILDYDFIKLGKNYLLTLKINISQIIHYKCNHSGQIYSYNFKKNISHSFLTSDNLINKNNISSYVYCKNLLITDSNKLLSDLVINIYKNRFFVTK